jgi:glycosyltransferase involved in cell wall biosynthesis
MRLAYATGRYNPDTLLGKNAHVRQFIAHTAALGHEIWSWSQIPVPNTRFLPSSRLGRLCALRRMDVLYIRCGLKPSFLESLAVFPYRQLVGSPLMVWEFNATPEFTPLTEEPAANHYEAIKTFRRLGRGCDLAVCVSDALAEYVRAKLGLRNVISVPNGSDPELFRPDVTPVRRVQRQPGQLNVGWIGSIYIPWHNFELLRDAANLLWERGQGPRFAFHIIGLGFKGFMRDLPPNINFYGPEDYELVPNWLAAMDVGLCLYKRGTADSNSPLKLFDYMASGLAVVGTMHPQLHGIFAELGQPDLLVSPDDPQALAEVLIRLADDPERVRRQGRAGRETVINFYNWRRAAHDTMRAIEAARDASRERRECAYRQGHLL